MTTPLITSSRRFAHAEADVVWAAIEALSDPLKHEVLRELASAVAVDEPQPTTGPSKVRKAVAALRQAYDLLGESPSVKQYRQLREQLPELQLPPDSTIRSYLGGTWNESLTRALLPGVSDGDFSGSPLGHAYEREELYAALRECVDELGVIPTGQRYIAWAKKAYDDGRPGRRPRSLRAFNRFGGFIKVLVDAGITDRLQGALDTLNRKVPALYAYEPEDCNDALREIVGFLGLDRGPRCEEYGDARRLILERAAANGEMRALPTAQTISKGMTWDEALVRAGFEPLARYTWSKKPGRRPSYTEEEMLTALRAAWAAKGEPFTGVAYESWRDEEIERLGKAGATPHVPTLAGITHRLGSWTGACEKAIPGYTSPRAKKRSEPDRVSRGPLSQDAVLGRGDPPLSCRDRGSTPRSCSSAASGWRSRAAVRSRMLPPILGSIPRRCESACARPRPIRA